MVHAGHVAALPHFQFLMLTAEDAPTDQIVSHDQRIKDIADRVLWLEDSTFNDMATMAIDPVCGMAVEQVSCSQHRCNCSTQSVELTRSDPPVLQ